MTVESLTCVTANGTFADRDKRLVSFALTRVPAMQPDVITSHARATVSLVLRGTCPRLRVLQFQDWYHTLAALQLPVLSPSSLAHRSLSAILLLSGPVIGQDGVLIQPIVATASLRFHHIETIGVQAGPFCSLFYGICLLLARTELVPRTPTPPPPIFSRCPAHV